MSYTIKGNVYTKTNSSNIVEKLDEGVYLLDGEKGSVIKQENYTIPERVFGDFKNCAERYLNTFRQRNANTNVLLSGEKGNGKSLLAKMICSMSKMPCVIVSKYIEDIAFTINSINQECIVLIDEFDKIYDTEEKQSELLSLLDGVFVSKKLFIFTSNKNSLNPYLQNRPGRIYYYKSFDNLPKSVVEEIVDEKLEDKAHKEEVINVSNVVGNMNIDTLLALIEEVNRYGESPFQVINQLNITFENIKYNVILLIEGKRREAVFIGHPLKNKKFTIEYKENKSEYWSRSIYSVNLDDFIVDFSEEDVIELRSKNIGQDTIIFRKIDFDNKFKISEIGLE